MIITWIIIGVLVLLGGWVLFTYNSLVRRNNNVKEAWSDIDVQLKRRHNLIPNLVETVKGYATHEQDTLQSVTEARVRAVGADSPQAQAEAENQLTSTLKTLFAVAESYPDLKANTNFLELQRELADTENKIQAARRFYNTNVRDYNTAVESAPTNVVANLFSFELKEFFEITEAGERSLPQVDFTPSDTQKP